MICWRNYLNVWSTLWINKEQVTIENYCFTLDCLLLSWQEENSSCVSHPTENCGLQFLMGTHYAVLGQETDTAKKWSYGVRALTDMLSVRRTWRRHAPETRMRDRFHCASIAKPAVIKNVRLYCTLITNTQFPLLRLCYCRLELLLTKYCFQWTEKIKVNENFNISSRHIATGFLNNTKSSLQDLIVETINLIASEEKSPLRRLGTILSFQLASGRVKGDIKKCRSFLSSRHYRWSDT